MDFKDLNTSSISTLKNTSKSGSKNVTVFEVSTPQTSSTLEKILLGFGKLSYYLKHGLVTPGLISFPDFETELSFSKQNTFGVIKITIFSDKSSFSYALCKITNNSVLIPTELSANGEPIILLFGDKSKQHKRNFATILENQNSIMVSDFDNNLEINWASPIVSI